MFNRMTVFAALLMASAASHATNWKDSGITPAGLDGRVMIDVDSFRTLPNNRATAWVSTPFEMKSGKVGSGVYRAEIRCDDYATAARTDVSIYEGGNGISPTNVGSMDVGRAFQEQVPGSVGELMAKRLCRMRGAQ